MIRTPQPDEVIPMMPGGMPGKMGGQPTIAGEGMSKAALMFTSWVVNILAGLAIMLVPIALFTLDLLLGPQFIWAYSKVNGNSLAGLNWWVPLMLSFALTGMQYALWERLEHGARTLKSKIMLAVGVAIALADSAIDVGGFTAWTRGAAAGAQIIPEDADKMWAIQAVIVFALCLFHEYGLQKALARYHNTLKQQRGKPVHKYFIAVGVWAAGWMLSMAKFVAIPAGVIGMLFLDIVLTPQGINTATGVNLGILAWIMSFGISGFQFLLWNQAEEVGIKGQGRATKVVLIGAWALVILDTAADVIGYTSLVYGSGEDLIIIPDNPSAVWFLQLIIVGALCLCSEQLARELLWRPWHDNRTIGGGKAKIPGFGGGMPFGGGKGKGGGKPPNMPLPGGGPGAGPMPTPGGGPGPMPKPGGGSQGSGTPWA